MRPFTYLLLLLTTLAQAQKTPIYLIPQPVEIQEKTGSFVLNKTTAISYDRPDAEVTANQLAQRLRRATGFALPVRSVKTASANSVLLRINPTPNATLGREGYELSVSPTGVVLSANQPAGLFYGTQTLLQLFPPDVDNQTIVKRAWAVPAVRVVDYPRFGWRGFMLDVSRNFFTKQQVMRYIDNLAQLKINTFHWHLTDDEGWRIEIKSLPRLTEVGAFRVPRVGKWGEREPPKPGEAATDGGFYTQDDIREVVRYAQERHITIVPEIDVPGHSMAAIAAYPELSTTKDPNTRVNPGATFAEWFPNGTFKMNIENALNPSDEKVYAFLDKVFTEVAALFPGQYIHVGGDECYKGYWEKDPGCQALMKQENMQHVEQLQGYFMKRMEQILKSKGKKLIGWDEILEGGIAPEATVMSWRGIKGGIEAAKMGHDVVMSPTTFAYIDYMQGDPTLEPRIYASLLLKTCYEFEPVPEGVDPQRILGGQANLWTEKIQSVPHAEYMSFPRVWALSEVYWSPKAQRNFAGFVPRMETQMARADRAGINYARAAYDPVVTPTLTDNKLMVSLDGGIPGLQIYYTLNDGMPGRYDTLYNQPFEIPEGPLTLRVITYRNGQPIGRQITVTRDELLKRVKK
ncbi:beta-N-acetylhexosaminidase [Spirosoma montaniterrae]|uniref:beta-N-acetylhexosaminidase n=1 Tax=Spirosoma montaniterrae TaxID=1178516 RepID=A0A1P9WVI0_9BACT|nr:family 20 glycosylhydrolase [Spirosoma montaniterrae]AQG79384.1 beta-N-acetylhexosaminidase [Spirosoma montaniterrae]